MASARSVPLFESRPRFGNELEESRVDVSPLIDCVFILLIFFIVTTAFVDEQGIEASIPQGGPTVLAEGKRIVIEVLDQQQLLIDGRPANVRSLRAILAGHLAGNPSASWVICPKAGATAGAFVEVMDELKLAGAATVFVGPTQ